MLEKHILFNWKSTYIYIQTESDRQLFLQIICQLVNRSFEGNWKQLYVITSGRVGYSDVFDSKAKQNIWNMFSFLIYVSTAHEYICVIQAIARWAELRWQQRIHIAK